MRRFASVVLAAALLAGGGASAQTVAPDGRTTYPAEWFARFAPTSAWDMAAQVPGFSVEDGEQVRGLAGAAGNVVINGARPSAKAESLGSLLARIPAKQVLRLELVPGRLIGGEYRARAQVLNVVLAGDAAGLSGSVDAALARVYTGAVTPSGGLSLLRRKGAQTLSLALRYDAERTPDEGYDLFVEKPSGALIERRDKFNDYFRQESSAAVGWGWEPGEGRSAHLNGRVWTWTNPLRHRSRVTAPAGDRLDTIDQDPTTLSYEFGGDAARPFAGGSLKIVGLTRGEKGENTELYFQHASDGAPIGGVAQAAHDLWGEHVARLTWGRDDVRGWALETGGEVALNSLDSQVDLSDVDAGGVRHPVDLPVSNVQVREVRGEAFVSGGRSLTSTVTADWGAAVETSTLTVSGDADSERTLTFFKPRAALEWRPDAAWRLRLAGERTVAQLNFGDFVSGAEIANSRVDGGNARLEPERTWRLTGEIERKVLGDGKLRLSLNADRVQMVQDRVRTEDGLDAPGNLGDGRRLGLEAVANLPLDRLGIAGGRVNLYGALRRSRVRDPFTGRDRRFSGETPWNLGVDFRQDLRGRNLAWGVSWGAEGDSPQYRMDEVDVWNPEDNYLSAFVETRPDSKTVLTFSVSNLLDRGLVRDRTFYGPDRSVLEPWAWELRRRRQGVNLSVQLKRSFGG